MLVALNRVLRQTIPGASLSAQLLPQCADISLWLLQDDYPQQNLSLEQTQIILNEPCYWCFCWASGLVLARYILANPQCVRDKIVLDLGCGSGVVAIAAAKAGAKQVIACDVDEHALQACRVNAHHNDVVLQYLSDLYRLEQPVDLITVADVLYDKTNMPLLQQARQSAQSVLLADSRVKDFNEAGYQYLCVEQAHTWPDLDESAEFRQVRLYRSI